MELEFRRTDLPCWKPLLRQIETQEQTQEVHLTDDMPDIGRILGAWGQVIHRAKEWRGDNVSFSGGVMAHVLFCGEDGEKCYALETWIPFQCRWNLDESARDGVARIQCLLRTLDARMVSARKIMLRCGIGAMAEICVRDTARIAVPENVPEHVELLTVRYPVRLPKAAGEKAFRVEEELTLPANAPKLGRMIGCTLQPTVSEAKVIGNKVVFRGNAGLHLMYQDDRGTPVSWNLDVPWSQFAQLEEEVSADAQPDIWLGITGLELEPEEDGSLQLKCGMVAQYLVDDRQILEIVEDAYSPSFQLEPKLGKLDLPLVLEQKQVPMTISQTLRQSAGQIVDVTYLPDFPQMFRSDPVQFQLPGQFQVLYRDGEGKLQGTLVHGEETWDTPADGNIRMEATVQPGSCSALAAGDSISLRSEVAMDLRCTARQPIPMVTGFTLGEEKTRDVSRPSLILRRAGGQRLWDIAKSTGSTVSGIRKANGLEREPEENRILLIPVK